jgi:hypothetical protein
MNGDLHRVSKTLHEFIDMKPDYQQLSTWIKYGLIAVLFLCIGVIVFLWMTLLPRMISEQTTPTPGDEPTIVEPLSTPIPASTPASTESPAGPTQSSTLTSFDVNTIHPQEDGAFISNPGIGWQYDTGDYESSKVLPETVAYYRHEFNWKGLNPSDGVFNWDILDQYINLARSEGKDVSFRVSTMLGESYGIQQVPDWVIKKGAKILDYGAPDYSNCVYQEEWSRFVQALIQKYDGNPDIAFIDISGYGNFNEWSWDDNQTEWDEDWVTNYKNGITDPAGLSTIDGQARRRLADMFIGGSNGSHQCRGSGSSTRTVSYTYTGFTKTQLIMPYAGIPDITQYVYSRRKDVGFRYDCLGRDATLDGLDNVLPNIWRQAPAAFEFCGWKPLVFSASKELLATAHGSLLHNNESPFAREELVDLLGRAGYRYFLQSAALNRKVRAGTSMTIDMTWKNTGNAPYYPKMGHSFELHLALTNPAGDSVTDAAVAADISQWMPAESAGGVAPDNVVNFELTIPSNVTPGEYTPRVYIKDLKTGQPIHLAMTGMDDQNRYPLPNVTIR